MIPQNIGRTRALSVVAIVIAACAIVGVQRLLGGLRLDELGHSLSHAAAGSLVVACVVTIGQQLCRAVFWKIALPLERAIPLRRLARYTLLGSAASVVMPLRAGEAVRVWLLARFERVPVIESVSTAVAERVVDLVAMLIVLSPLPFIVSSLPRWLPWVMVLSAGSIAILVGVVVWLGKRSSGPVARVLEALRPLRRPSAFSLACLALVTSWLLDVAAVSLVAHSLGIALPASGPLLVLLSVNVAIGLPTTPGQLGVHEAGSLVALHALGVPAGPSVAFALLYHAAHILPLLAVAAVNTTTLVFAMRTVRDGQPSAPIERGVDLRISMTRPDAAADS